jgi:uncharacterized protein involved in response to NO
VTDAAGAANADMLTATPSERRTTGAFALFEYGYRPFFLLAALHVAVLAPVWVAAVFGWLELPVEMEVSWRAHQMVCGFAAAGLAGFSRSCGTSTSDGTPRATAIRASVSCTAPGPLGSRSLCGRAKPASSTGSSRRRQ